MPSSTTAARPPKKPSRLFYSVFILAQASLISTVVALVIVIEDAQHAAVRQWKAIWLILSAALTFALTISLATLWTQRRKARKHREVAADQRRRRLWAGLPEAPSSEWSAGVEASLDVELSRSSRKQWQGAVGEGAELRHFKSCQQGKMLETPVRSDSKYWEEMAVAAIMRTGSGSFTPCLKGIDGKQGEATAGLAITSDEERRISAASKDTVGSTGTVVVHSRLEPPRIDSQFWMALATSDGDVAPPVPPNDDSTPMTTRETKGDSVVMVEEAIHVANDSPGKSSMLSRRGLQPLLIVTSPTPPEKRPLRCIEDMRNFEASLELQRYNRLALDGEKEGLSGTSNQDSGWGTEESASDTIMDEDVRNDLSSSFEGVVPYDGT